MEAPGVELSGGGEVSGGLGGSGEASPREATDGVDGGDASGGVEVAAGSRVVSEPDPIVRALRAAIDAWAAGHDVAVLRRDLRALLARLGES